MATTAFINFPYAQTPAKPKFQMFDFVLGRIEEPDMKPVNISGFVVSIAWDVKRQQWVYELDSTDWGCARWDESDLLLVRSASTLEGSSDQCQAA